MRHQTAFNRLPRATYRLQFNRGFAFPDAAAITDYLQELGISDLYASPLFLAGPDSSHGYDVCGFNALNPVLGSDQVFHKLCDDLRSRRMGLLIDMVPNHMGSHAENSWWNDVLRHGPDSAYARFFDIDWNARPDRKVLLPILGDRYANVLARNELQLGKSDNGEVVLTYFGRKFPLSDSSCEELREANLEDINGRPERLHSIIQEQHYRPAFWRVGPHEINYRRFFDVTELVSVRVEDEKVFEQVHQFLFQLLRDKNVTGVRVDHPDGLRDPKTYFDRLQRTFHDAGENTKLYVVAEKILSDTERLPEDWPVAGTTGYDYLNQLNGVFIAEQAEPSFTQLYQSFTGLDRSYEQVSLSAKKEVLRKLFPSEVLVLTHRLRRIADMSMAAADFTIEEIREAIIEYIAHFPVYRTYVRQDRLALTEVEQRYVDAATEAAAQSVLELKPLFVLLRSVFSVQENDDEREFVLRFQQLTGPATAKGLEDTAFYRYLRFVSLNEVGGNPGRFGLSIEAFHEFNVFQHGHWPHSLLASATHDTKRGEDLRARLNVLSEIPAEWERKVLHWSELNRVHKTGISGELAPTSNDEYLLYQILAGSWIPGQSGDLDPYITRLQAYMLKATREAKQRTSWTDPYSAYEEATNRFTEAVVRSEAFRASFEQFQRRLSFFGVFNSLSQTLLKICSPGVPDFYQGTELWDFNLVDPDNRRPVNFKVRATMLSRIQANAGGNRLDYLKNILEHAEDGEIKMFVIWAALQFRRSEPKLFESGEYIPLRPRGAKEQHVIAFRRNSGDKSFVVVVPRFCSHLTGGNLQAPIGPGVWADTELELPGRYRDIFAQSEYDGVAALGDVFSAFPVALLRSV